MDLNSLCTFEENAMQVVLTVKMYPEMQLRKCETDKLFGNYF